MDSRGLGTTFLELSGSSLAQVQVPLAPLEAQQAIADYLDRETAQIDAFIAKNEELIALLAERRTATITSALTSGLEENPDGHDGRWFGAIPAHWESMPLRYLLRRIEQGVSPQTEGGLAEGAHQFGVLKSGCVNAGIYRPTEHKLLPAEFNFDRSLLVRPGDLVVNRASGSIPLLGSAAIVTKSPYRLILSDKTFRLIPNARTSSHYLYWLLNSRIYREQVESSVSGADGLANNLPQSSLRRFVLPVPPIEEQERINSHLTERCMQIDQSIAIARRGADLARERRAALISAAVTGKIDVGVMT
jgi:type I restriction enzyme S subunit